MAQVLASLDIPAKISVPAFALARLIYAGRWDAVQEACEGDVISTALLLTRWRQLHDPRANAAAVEDRILRRVADCAPGAATSRRWKPGGRHSSTRGSPRLRTTRRCSRPG